MEWIVEPDLKIKIVEIVNLGACCGNAVFSTDVCKWYSECNGTAKLKIVDPPKWGLL